MSNVEASATSGVAASPTSASARRARVLYLAFYFPPLGGGGVQRALKFAKYLPEFGFEPWIVTGAATQRTRHAPLDASLGSEAPPETRVFRVAEPLPDDLRPDRLRRLLGRPSRFASAWRRQCVETGLGAAAGGRVDVILASMSPFETSAAATTLSAQLGAPWVADLRDPWALDEMAVYPTRWHRALDLRRMRRCLASASFVIMNTPEAARAVDRAFPELAGRTEVITNGFDEVDFAGTAPRCGDVFRIVHTGSLHVGLGTAHRRRRWLRRLAGGERVEVDILARSHVYLLRALEQWQRERPDEFARAELVLAGDLSPADRRVIAHSPVFRSVRTPGYVSHAESVALLRSADLLFLPMHGLPAGERARIVPGKTYEYLAARRPILAAVPDGDARDFVLASGLADVCAPDDARAMLDVLQRRFAEKQAGREVEPAPDSFYRQFERRELAKKLARSLASVIPDAARRGEPGRDRQT